MHTTLDGFVAGSNREMDWINLDGKLFDLVGKLTDQVDIAFYGRKTFEMMNSYWPTAGDKPDASKHDKEHSAWYNKVSKIILSRTMQGAKPDNTKIITTNLSEKINEIKQQGGKDILIFGSASASHSLMENNLIDDYWLFVNPILIGQGIPLFKNIKNGIKLKLIESILLSSGVVCLHYEKQ